MTEKVLFMARNAEKNNDKLFPLFQKSLSSDHIQEFSAAADKLAGWLSKDKAYYAKARPMIVMLMETAHDTVRRHSANSSQPFHLSQCTDAVKPWADAFTKVVRTVVPFYLMFPEEALQLRLRKLIQTICDDVDVFLRQQQFFSRSVADSLTPSAIDTPRPSFSPPNALCSPVSLQQPTPGQSPTVSTLLSSLSPVSPGLAGASTAIVVPQPSPFSPIVSRTEAPTPHALSPTANSLSAPRGTAPQLPSRTLSAPVLSVKRPLPQTDATDAMSGKQAASPVVPNHAASVEQFRPKVKKRKTISLDTDFIEADLNWYKGRQSNDTSTGVQDADVPGPSTIPFTPAGGDETNATLLLEAKKDHALLPAESALQETKPTLSAAVQDIQPLAARVDPSLGVTIDKGTEDSTSRPAADAQALAGSPVILAPSLTRRLPEPCGSPSKIEGPSEIPLKVPSPPADDKLPSPLTSKKVKTKRKGLLGLKILPIPTPLNAAPKESLAVDEPMQNGSVRATPECSAVSASTPVPFQSRSTSTPVSRADSSPEARSPSSASSAQLPEDTSTRVDSAPSMEVDEPRRPTDDVVVEYTGPALPSHHAAADEKPRASGEVDMWDSPCDVTTTGAAEEKVVANLATEPATPHKTRAAPAREPLFLPSPGSASTFAASGASPSFSAPETSAAPLKANGSSSSVDSESAMELLQGHVATQCSVNGIQDAVSSNVTIPAAAAVATPAATTAHTFGSSPTLANGDAPPSLTAPSPVVAPTAGSATALLTASDAGDAASPFASTCVRVLSMARGAPSPTPGTQPVVLDFELTVEELAQINRWNKHRQLTEDVSDSLCVSFMSYYASQVAGEASKQLDGNAIIAECGQPAPWPQDLSAFVIVNGGDGANTFTVSPPFITTPNKCVDLCPRSLRHGRNTLHLFQYRDHSDRIFMVLLHHPTRAQLAEMEAARNEERKWREALERLGKIEVRVPRLFPTMALGNGFLSRS